MAKFKAAAKRACAATLPTVVATLLSDVIIAQLHAHVAHMMGA